MLKIFGKDYSREDQRRFFGDPAAVAGTRRIELRDGKSKGVRLTQVVTGSGLMYEVNESRGLDLGRCYFKGLPVSYMGYNNEVAPEYFNGRGDSWLWQYGGGLMVGCGLTQIGSPCTDEGEPLPQHGWLSNEPAEWVNVSREEVDGEDTLVVCGKVRESKALSRNVSLTRRVSSRVCSNEILIEDSVENEGFQRQPLMLLYHFNIGHPILDAGAKFLSKTEGVQPGNDVAAARTEPNNEYLGPTPSYGDAVYFRKLKNESGTSLVGIVNEKINLGLSLEFNADVLDCFTQWKFTSEGNYVAGLEPATAYVGGREAERCRGTLKYIEPQQVVKTRLVLRLLTTPDEVGSFEGKF